MEVNALSAGLRGGCCLAGRRKFSKAFKSQVVEEFLAGEVTQARLVRRYDLSDHLILQWRRRCAEGKLEEIAGSLDKDERIKELKRMVRRCSDTLSQHSPALCSRQPFLSGILLADASTIPTVVNSMQQRST